MYASLFSYCETMNVQISEPRRRIVEDCCHVVEEFFTKASIPTIDSRISLANQDDAVFFAKDDNDDTSSNPQATDGQHCASDQNSKAIEWEKVPPSLRPHSEYCELNADRALNKERQLESLLRHILPIIDRLYEKLQKQHSENDQNSTDPSNPRLEVVEFGSGSGHLGLLVAHFRRETTRVRLLERKEYACQQAQRRIVAASGLDNVQVVTSSIHDFADYCATNRTIGPHAPTFHLGISLHSCGVLTDAALALCVQQGAAFCLCPCCYGQTVANLPPNYLPRSKVLHPLREGAIPMPHGRNNINSNTNAQQSPDKANSMEANRPAEQTIPSTSKERRLRRKLRNDNVTPFCMVARTADCTSAAKTTKSKGRVDGASQQTDYDGGDDEEDDDPIVDESFTSSPNFQMAKRCMRILDTDRLLWVREQGYPVAYMASLQPLHVTPKNNLIIGMPAILGSRCSKEEVDATPLEASARENFSAARGEEAKTGRDNFQHEATSISPSVRRIYGFDHLDVDKEQQLASCKENGVFPFALHIENAFSKHDLEKLDDLRLRIPLDVSRPTCPRRFLTEKPVDPDDKSVLQQHRENGWVGQLIDAALESWKLPFPMVSLPWYRFLEYTEPGGHMKRHSDGSNLHPGTRTRSVATMLIYLSTCRTGGETTLYRSKKCKKSRQKSRPQPEEVEDEEDVIESIKPMHNTVLIFPHNWPHSGDPVVEDTKIALRVDLTWKPRRQTRTMKHALSSTATTSMLFLGILLAVLLSAVSAQQEQSNPMTLNGGSCLAMAGKNCVALIMDDRFGQNTGLINIQARHVLFGSHTAALSQSERSQPHHYLVALQGLQADVLTLEQELKIAMQQGYHHPGTLSLDNPSNNNSPQASSLSPRALASWTSHLLYQRKQAPYYVEPLIIGLEPVISENKNRKPQDGVSTGISYRPYLCSMDVLGSLQEQPTLTDASKRQNNVNGEQTNHDDNDEPTFCCMGAASPSLYGTAQAFWKPHMTPQDLTQACVQAFLAACERDCLSGYGARLYLVTPQGITVQEVTTRND